MIQVVTWCLHWLPYAWVAKLGEGLGAVLYRWAARTRIRAVRKRRDIALCNLRLCFPDMSDVEREALALAHFRAYGRALLEHSFLWWSSRRHLRKLIQLSQPWPQVGEVSVAVSDPASAIDQADTRPIIFWVPHFVSIQVVSHALVLERAMTNIYQRQRNLKFDRWLTKRRQRHGNVHLYARDQGIRPIIKHLREGMSVVLSSDMDFGSQGAEFVPFFGVPAATVTGPFRLAQQTNARLIPVLARFADNYQGWELTICPELAVTRPDGNGNAIPLSVVDVLRQAHQQLEGWIGATPEQYLWVHRRFKTRPPGEADVYLN